MFLGRPANLGTTEKLQDSLSIKGGDSTTSSANVLMWDTTGSQENPAATLTLTNPTFGSNTWTSDTSGVLAADSGTWSSITLGTSNAVRVILSDSAGQVANLDGAKSPLDGGASG